MLKPAFWKTATSKGKMKVPNQKGKLTTPNWKTWGMGFENWKNGITQNSPLGKDLFPKFVWTQPSKPTFPIHPYPQASIRRMGFPINWNLSTGWTQHLHLLRWKRKLFHIPGKQWPKPTLSSMENHLFTLQTVRNTNQERRPRNP